MAQGSFGKGNISTGNQKVIQITFKATRKPLRGLYRCNYGPQRGHDRLYVDSEPFYGQKFKRGKNSRLLQLYTLKNNENYDQTSVASPFIEILQLPHQSMMFHS